GVGPRRGAPVPLPCPARQSPPLARPVACAAEAAVAELAAASAQPVDLLTAMQSLALEIAGTSMFSLAMKRYAPELRDFIIDYTAHLGRPTFLDFVLPPPIPSPRDFARRRVRRRWMKLVGPIIAERRGETPEAAPRDLFDFMFTARHPPRGAPLSAQRALGANEQTESRGH